LQLTTGLFTLSADEGELQHGAEIVLVSALGSLNRGLQSLELAVLQLGAGIATVLSLLWR